MSSFQRSCVTKAWLLYSGDTMSPLLCTPFPERLSTHPVVYAVDVVIVPIVFGLGLFGGLLSLIVLQRYAG